jgi:valyl-tRNA synthetase
MDQLQKPTEELAKQYDHQAAQDRWYAFWETQGYFHSEPDPNRKPFTIVIPPPNVTGALHLGHALNNTLQDIQVRFHRMQGYNTLWMPGTDHAGIATQAVVERRLLSEEGQSRHDLGREGLIQRIWQWKAAYERRIIGQLKQMGCSCDWQRLRFTLDDTCARAVRHTFFSLFSEQLIYRGKRLVNWDTFLQTAVSDDEVVHETVQGNFWHLKYRVIGPKPGEPAEVTLATTRPETMLGDTAVAVHPDPAAALDQVEAELRDKLATAPEKQRPELEHQLEVLQQRRTAKLASLEMLRDMALDGRQVMLPLQEREVPLVADVWAKPELGSGCVKITPAHDPNDYEVAQRQNLPMINILNPDGTLNENAGTYAGLGMAEARARIVKELEAQGLVAEIEDREIEIAHSDRSKTPIEPYLADQWFVKMDQLAQSAMDAVQDGRVKIFPGRYAKGYLDWLSEKRDWPVSRQLWWGHRIPVWYNDTADEAALQQAFAHRDDVVWHRDEERGRWLVCSQEEDLAEDALPGHQLEQEVDVLDTWFSSALWPHSTLGWPEKTAELEYYYPTSVLITSRDIITLWVARMVLAGLHNVGEVPFREVYIHPKILDGFGEGMSKSKGNGVDPLDVMEKFGADALRFGIAYLTTETQDVRLPVEFECPHCGATFAQTKENRIQPRLDCPKCSKPLSTQWAEKPEDTALPRGSVISERFELGRNYCNKLWNASRFALMNLEGYTAQPVAPEALTVEDRWLLSRLATVTTAVTEALAEYRYAEAARQLYDFAWEEFCSFYVEMAKNRLQQEDARPVAQRVLAHSLDTLLRLLHPMIPFLTEEVWQRLGEVAPQRGLVQVEPAAESVMIAPWPVCRTEDQDPQVESRFARFQEVLRAVREIRTRQGIAPKREIEFRVRCSIQDVELLKPMEPYFRSMACAGPVAWGPDVQPPDTQASITLGELEVMVDLAGLIDVEAEVERNSKEAEKLRKLIEGKKKQLANENFVARAPQEVVQKERDNLDELISRLEAAEAALVTLRAQ